MILMLIGTDNFLEIGAVVSDLYHFYYCEKVGNPDFPTHFTQILVPKCSIIDKKSYMIKC